MRSFRENKNGNFMNYYKKKMKIEKMR